MRPHRIVARAPPSAPERRPAPVFSRRRSLARLPLRAPIGLLLPAMARFRFVHAADLHLDAPFSGLEARARDVAARARDASLDAVDRLADLALETGSRFVLLAGDLYEGERHGVRAQLRLHRALERLAAAGIETFIVHGNHDPLSSGWSAIRSWPEGVHLFSAESVEGFEIREGAETIALVHGISFGSRDPGENLARRFSRRRGGPPFQIGLLHASVSGSSDDHQPYAPCTMDDLEAAGMDYWALGHVHRRQEHRRRSCWVVYPGNTQGRSFKPSERGPKGATVVEVDGSRVVSVRFRPLDSLRFIERELDLAGARGLSDLIDRLERLARSIAAENPGVDLALRVRLSGRSELHRRLARPGTLEGLVEELRARRTAQDGIVWWAELRDATLPELDLEEIRGRGDFAGELLRAAERVGRSPEAARELVERACGRPPSLGGILRLIGEPSLDPDEAREIVERASLAALDLLLPGDGEADP
ncbi:MAG: DNA repair exonuclease [Acidobacteria bacterium]|nr:MAG: DNA repair exonuclease [Acidobacteriota bacterium]